LTSHKKVLKKHAAVSIKHALDSMITGSAKQCAAGKIFIGMVVI